MTADDVLEFWFQQCRPWQWFRRRDSFDELVRDRFAALVERALAGDQQAKALSQKALQQGWIQQEKELAKRQLWLMPLLHSEENEVLVQAIPLLEQFADVATADVASRHLIQL